MIDKTAFQCRSCTRRGGGDLWKISRLIELVLLIISEHKNRHYLTHVFSELNELTANYVDNIRVGFLVHVRFNEAQGKNERLLSHKSNLSATHKGSANLIKMLW